MIFTPQAMRELSRLLGILDIHLTSSIESNEVPGVPITGQEPEIRKDFADRLRAREWRKTLRGNLPKTNPGRARSRTPKKGNGTEANGK